VVINTAHDGATANLADGHIEKDLHSAAEGYFLVGADVQATEGKVFHVTNVAMGAGLPSHNNALGRLDSGMLSLLLVLQGRSKEENAGLKAV
jgi:hypothetical protein